MRLAGALPLVLPLALAACGGGGGGGTPLLNPPRVLLADVDVPAGRRSAALEIGLASEGKAPVLLQIDVVTDPARIRLRNDVEPLGGVGTAEAGTVAPGRLRIVFGDALTRTDPDELPTGAVVRVPFDVVPGVGPGTVEVRVESVTSSDAQGGEDTVERAGPTATITLR